MQCKVLLIDTYLWIVLMHPSPLPHQLLSLLRPQPDCRAPEQEKHRKRGKVIQGVQKPPWYNSKQLEHHLRHQCPTGTPQVSTVFVVISFHYV